MLPVQRSCAGGGPDRRDESSRLGRWSCDDVAVVVVALLLRVPLCEVAALAGPRGGKEYWFEGILLSSHDEETTAGRGVFCRKRCVSNVGDESERLRVSEVDTGRGGLASVSEDDGLLGSADIFRMPNDSRDARGCTGSEGGGDTGTGEILKGQT